VLALRRTLTADGRSDLDNAPFLVGMHAAS